MSTIDNSEAVSRVAPSIVRVTYYEGSNKYTRNGTIFWCTRDDEKAQFVSYILTNTRLFQYSCIFNQLQPPPYHPYLSTIPDKSEPETKQGASKLRVRLSTNEIYEGEVMACDMDMEIVVVKVTSDDALPVALLTPITDWISVAPGGVSESYAKLQKSPYPTKLFPGDELTIVCQGKSNLHVKKGIHSLDRIVGYIDIGPFLRINCKHIIIDGAPVINCEGDVIGAAFNGDEGCVAFLPVNIFLKWWKHVFKYGEICRPFMGMSFTNFYGALVSRMEDAVHDCGVYDGVIVDRVFDDAPASNAGLCSYDFIYQCNGRPVRSLLEFAEFMWDKSGEVFEAKGVRDGCPFVWNVEIQAITDSLVPQILAESFPKNVAAKKRRRKGKSKDKKEAKKDKERIGSDSDSASGRKNKISWEVSGCSS